MSDDDDSKYLKNFHACSNCGEAYEDQEEAFNCCPPQIVDRYVCPECNTDWLTHEEAKECHEACEMKNHMAKLEAAGQMRLID